MRAIGSAGRSVAMAAASVLVIACSASPVAVAPAITLSPAPSVAVATPTVTPLPAPTPTVAPTTAKAWQNVVLIDERLAISIPGDWEARPTETESLFYGPHSEGLWVATDPRGDDTLATVTAKALAGLEEEATVVANDASTVGGLASRRFTLVYDSEPQMLCIIEAFVHGDLTYGLTWGSPVGNEAADLATFQQIIDSIEWLE